MSTVFFVTRAPWYSMLPGDCLKLRRRDQNNYNLFIPLAYSIQDRTTMTEAEQEKDSRFIRRLVIIIFIVFTLAAIVMTIFYGTPWAKK